MARRGLTAGVGLLVLAIGCAVAQASSSPAVVLVDSRSGAYLQPGAPASIEQHSLAPLLAAFSGLLPGQAIDEALSNQVGLKMRLWAATEGIPTVRCTAGGGVYVRS